MHNKQHGSIDKRRMFIVLLVFTLCMTVWMARLLWLQLASSSSVYNSRLHMVHHTVNQRMKAIVSDSGRGDIYDRRMQPLTGSTIRSLVVFPNVMNESAEGKLNLLPGILHSDRERWESFIENLSEPNVWMDEDGIYPQAISTEQEMSIRSLHIPGIEVIDYTIRYPAQSIARHLIGFMAEQPERIRDHYAQQLKRGELTLTTPIGASGLEFTFESILRGNGKTRFAMFTDGKGRYLEGLATRVISPDNPYYPVKVITTLDGTMQREIERIMDELDIQQGAVVVLDAKNADIVAMASRPQFNPYQVNPKNINWNNRALKALEPGSIFKTVVAAAALEAGVSREDEVFHCDGKLGKYGFTCWKKTGHGSITLHEAYAQSCNIVFAKVAERLAAEQLEQTSRKLGMLQRIGWEGDVLGHPLLRQLDREEAGQLFASGTLRNDGGVMIQTAIGQRDVRMTVLQAANMVVSLLNQGELRAPRIVTEVRYQNDRLKITYPEKILIRKQQGISMKTSRALLRWMEETVTQGTARTLHSVNWKLAGKTGTAQVKTGSEVAHQWFAGYGAVGSPRYAIAIVVENVANSQEHMALRLAKEIAAVLTEQ